MSATVHCRMCGETMSLQLWMGHMETCALISASIASRVDDLLERLLGEAPA